MIRFKNIIVRLNYTFCDVVAKKFNYNNIFNQNFVFSGLIDVYINL